MKTLKRAHKVVSILSSIVMLVQPLIPAFQTFTPKVFAEATTDQSTPSQEQTTETNTVISPPSDSPQSSPTNTTSTTAESPTVAPIPTATTSPNSTPDGVTQTPTATVQPSETGPPSDVNGDIGPDGASTTTTANQIDLTESTTSASSAKQVIPVEQVCVTNDQQFSDTTNDSWNIDLEKGAAETKGSVQLGVKYQFPQENKVTVTFNCLPKDESLRTSLKIQKVKLSDLKVPDDVKPSGEFAYDITTGMKDGDFKYDVTLPKPDNQAVEVAYMEDPNASVQTVSSDRTSQEGDKVKGADLNHFTIFFVSTTMSVYASFTGASQVTVYPSAPITANLQVTTSSVGNNTADDWSSSQYLIEGGSWSTCDSSPSFTTDGTYSGTLNITAPSITGTYDLSLRVFNSNNCTGGAGTFAETTLPDAITVTANTSIPFTEEFGLSNASTVANWYENDPAEIFSGTGNDAPTNGEFARLGEGGWICRPFNATGIANLTLSYDWKGNGNNGNDHGIVEYKSGGNCGDSNGWTNVDTNELSDTTWGTQTHTFAGNSIVLLRFKTSGAETGEYFRVDNITLTEFTQPDLTVQKSHTPTGNAMKTQAFTWKIHVANGGTGAAAFTTGQNVLIDNLPSSGATYGAPSVSNQTGITGTIGCAIASNNLTCSASGAVSIAAGGSFDVTWSTTPTATGSLINPRSGSGNKCAVDPDSHITESDENHNSCSETVTVDAYNAQNPALGQACGLDVSLVIDNSNSISGTELGQIQTALTHFVNTLAGTPTQFSVTKFGTNASVPQGFTSDTTAVNNAINGVTTGGGGTDWQKAFIAARGTFDPRPDKPNLMIFATDGNPTFPNCGGASSCQADVDAAVTEANTTKEYPIRVLALGVGADVNVANLKAISGPTQGSSMTSDVVLVSDFASLDSQFAAFASESCGGHISFNKYVDGVQKSDGKTWTFNVDGTTTLTTDTNGQAVTGTLSVANHSVTEPQTSIPSGYSYDHASCTKDGSPIGTVDNTNHAVNNIPITSSGVFVCNFYNTKNPVKGTLTVKKVVVNDNLGIENANDFTFSVNGGAPITFTQSTDSLHAENVLSLDAGTYTATEAAFPGYATTYDNCSGIVLAAGGSATCTITNNDISPAPGTIIVKKVLVGPTSWATGFDFSGAITGKITTNNGTLSSTSVAVGAHTVTEGSTDGWDLTGIACDDGASTQPSSGNVSTKTATFNVDPGETVTCTYTNAKRPKIKITKTVVGGTAAPSDFQISLLNPSGQNVQSSPIFGSTAGTSFELGLPQYTFPGVFTVREASTSGYTTTFSGACTQTNATDATVTLNYGDNGTCTVTNTRQAGTIKIIKDVVPDDDHQSVWNFAITGPTNNNVDGLHDDGQSSAIVSNAGDYTIREIAQAGSDLDNYRVSYACTGSSTPISGNGSSAGFTLSANQNIVCTFTNAKLPTLKLTKTVENKGVGTATPANWTLGAYAIGDPISFTGIGPTVGPYRVNPGVEYIVSEAPGGPSGYSPSAWTCSGGTTRISGGNILVTLAMGQDVTCGITNTRDTGSILVHKVVDANGDSTFETADAVANTLGFQWGLDGVTPARDMGSTASGVTTGTHNVSENSVTNYHLVGWYRNGGEGSCSNPDSRQLPASVDAFKDTTTTITLCNAVNTGSIIVHKDVQGPDGEDITDTAHTFTMQVDDSNSQDLTDGGSVTYTNLPAGNHTITESVVDSHYDLYGISTSVGGSGNTGGLSVNVATNQQTNVYVTNRQHYGSITVHKEVDASGSGTFVSADPGDFTWTVDGAGTNAMGSTLTTVTPGTRLISENNVDNYHFVGWYPTGDERLSCTNIPEATQYAELPIHVSVGPDGTSDFTICNTRDTGNVTVTKFDDTNGNGTKDEGEPVLSDWTINLSGSDSQTTDENGQVLFNPVLTGTHILSEDLKQGWKQTGIYCTNEQTIETGPIENTLTQFISSKVYAQEDAGHQVHVGAGENVSCFIGNLQQDPILTITKSNNATGDLSPGGTVTFTITVTATQSAAYNVQVIDLPSKGFNYHVGSQTAVSTVAGHDLSGALTHAYASPGIWNLGTMSAGETVTLTYQTDIDSGLNPGLYKDLALAYGCKSDASCATGDSMSVFATAINPGFVSTNHVGTQISIVKDQQNGATLNPTTGEVLGASTELPATGASEIWLAIAGLLFVAGLGFMAAGHFTRRNYV